MSLIESMQSSMPAMALKIMASRLVAAGSSKSGHSGTTLPGKLILKTDANIISHLSSGLEAGVIVVSATNGKTTTCAMISGILEVAGQTVVRNREGANLAAGVASALLKNATFSGKTQASAGLFEVDEAAFPAVASQCKPRIALLMNLFRDQLDRYGELEHIATIWRDSLKTMPGDTVIVLNADDPLIASMAAIRPEQTITYGIEDEKVFAGTMQHASDSKYCAICGSPFDYRGTYIGHLGIYACSGCDNARPTPIVSARNVQLNGMNGSSFELLTASSSTEIALKLPGLYNIYNALGAAAACTSMGVAPETIASGLKAFGAAFGRVEKIRVNSREVMLLLVKNPAGFNEVLRTLGIEPGEKTLMLALNDKIADGRDISWIWDVDMELLADCVKHVVCSGTRAWEIAMRLKYAGINSGKIEVDTDLQAALRRSLEQTANGETLYILPTYTAMLALRQMISQHFITDRKLEDLVWK